MSDQASLGDISDNSESSNQKSSENEFERRTICGIPPEDWKSKRLENITEIVSGKSLPTEEQGESEGFPVYKVEDMNKSENFKYMNSADNYLKKEKIRELNHSLHPESTVILPKVGAALLTNKRRILTEKASFDNNTMGWIPGEELNPEFFYYTTCRVDMESYAQKGAVPSISKSIAGNLKFPVPEKDEQRRIASVLYNVDQAISKTEEIIEQTQRVKKGLMQDLFTEGYYSHEEFEEHQIGPNKFVLPKGWKLKELGEFIKEFNGGANLSPSDFTEEGVKVFPKGGVNNRGIAELDEDEKQFVSESYAEENQKYLVGNGYLMTALRDLVSSGPNIGRIVEIPEGDKYLMAQGVYGLKIDEEKLNRHYLAHLSNSRFYRKRMKQIKVGSTQVHIRKPVFSGVKIPVPPKDEQEEIAQVFNNINNKIRHQKSEKEQLQRLKKGLMQDLLTGEVRTNEKVEVLEEVIEA
jgi:type I restriction enzyme S subunit